MKKMSYKEVKESIIRNHNHSWYEDIYVRNKDNKEKTALFFRGTNVTYSEFFDMVEDYAKALKQYGVSKGDEFVACLRQTPDYPVLVAAASLIGAKINLIAADFDKDYVVQIIENADADIVLVADWDFVAMSPVLRRIDARKTIVVLPVKKWDKQNNPYSAVTDKFFRFDEDAYNRAVETFSNVIDVDRFLRNGMKYNGKINGHGKLEDELAITYTSGSTRKGVHKGVVQRNETYIIMGRYHDPEVAGIPKMDNTVTLAAIGPHADTVLMTGVSDTLLQGGIVALDPIIDEKYFLHSLRINNAGLAVATRTFWMRAMKETYQNPEFRKLTLPGLYVPSEGGEPLSAGEERALNQWLRKVKAGVKITHTPFSIVKMTVGGGDSEHGSLFLALFRGYSNLLQKIRGIHEPMGLGYYNFVDIQVLREDGTYCEPMELGRLVANAPIAMKKYHNNPEATKEYFVQDVYGKTWGDLRVYGYIDKWNKVYLKGRIDKNDPEIKTFQIADEILRDDKNIMSCEVVTVFAEDNTPVYVAHVELQFFKSVNMCRVLLAAERRCMKRFGSKLDGKLFFRVRTHEEGFPTLFTTKRNLIALTEEGVSEDCIVPSEHYRK
ncbi:MAG: acyl--CoA ligase [Lachnospiraceae bacterium]|nr:acyl--CoA ligase [Lachnospiraceae bacterium]